jgi:hypothetical protein
LSFFTGSAAAAAAAAAAAEPVFGLLLLLLLSLPLCNFSPLASLLPLPLTSLLLLLLPLPLTQGQSRRMWFSEASHVKPSAAAVPLLLTRHSAGRLALGASGSTAAGRCSAHGTAQHSTAGQGEGYTQMHSGTVL